MKILNILDKLKKVKGLEELTVIRAAIDYGKEVKVTTEPNEIIEFGTSDFKLALVFVHTVENEGLILQLKKGKVNYLKFWRAVVINDNFFVLKSNKSNLTADKFELYYEDMKALDMKKIYANLKPAMEMPIQDVDSMLGKLLFKYDFPSSYLRDLDVTTYEELYNEIESRMIVGDISKYIGRVINYISLEFEEVRRTQVELNKQKHLLALYKNLQPLVMTKERLDLMNAVDRVDTNKLKSIIALISNDTPTQS